MYNDWASEFCSAAPDRLLGVGLVPVGGPIEEAIKEAERVAKMKGIRSVSIPAVVRDRPYLLPDWDPLWAALQDLGLPVAIHVGTGENVFKMTTRLRRMNAMGVDGVDGKIGGPMHTIAELIWGGVPQRFPKLRFAMVEGGIGWIASMLRSMDHTWKDHHRWMAPDLEEPPSFYFHRQFWATFEDDRPGILTRELLNVEHLMWGSDYPHTEGTFPHSREQIAKDFAGAPEAEVYKMVTDNAARLYGLTA